MSVRIYYRPEHRQQPGMASTAEEVDAFLDDLLAQPYETSMANLYPAEQAEGDFIELSVGLDPERGVGGLQYSGPGGRWFSKDRVSEYEQVVYCYFGNGCEYPHDSEVPIDLIRKAVVEFLESGGERPKSVEWQASQAP